VLIATGFAIIAAIWMTRLEIAREQRRQRAPFKIDL
jgi:predicted outer membrane lipoprotein